MFQQTPEGLLDPKTLTPDELYKLQSDTWAQGMEYERAKWHEWLERIRTWNEGKSRDYNEGWLAAEVRIIKLWEQEMNCKCEDAMNHLATLIKGEK